MQLFSFKPITIVFWNNQVEQSSLLPSWRTWYSSVQVFKQSVYHLYKCWFSLFSKLVNNRSSMDKCSTYQKKKTYRRLKGVENPFILTVIWLIVIFTLLLFKCSFLRLKLFETVLLGETLHRFCLLVFHNSNPKLVNYIWRMVDK